MCERDQGLGPGAGGDRISGVVPGRVRVVRGPAGKSSVLLVPGADQVLRGRKLAIGVVQIGTLGRGWCGVRGVACRITLWRWGAVAAARGHGSYREIAEPRGDEGAQPRCENVPGVRGCSCCYPPGRRSVGLPGARLGMGLGEWRNGYGAKTQHPGGASKTSGTRVAVAVAWRGGRSYVCGNNAVFGWNCSAPGNRLAAAAAGRSLRSYGCGTTCGTRTVLLGLRKSSGGGGSGARSQVSCVWQEMRNLGETTVARKRKPDAEYGHKTGESVWLWRVGGHNAEFGRDCSGSGIRLVVAAAGRSLRSYGRG